LRRPSGSSQRRFNSAVRPGAGLSVALTAAGLLAVAGTARANTATWNASSSANWSGSGNWTWSPSGSGVPTSADDVVISGGSATVNMDSAVDVNSITVSGACSRLIRPNPATTTIRIRNNLTLSSTAGGGIFRLSSGTSRIGGQLTRSNNNMALDSNGGTVLFDAASGTKTHTMSGATLEKVIFNDGLVGYWNLDEGAGATINDLSGFGNNGTLNGTFAYTASMSSTIGFTDVSGVTFNGSNVYATLGTTSLPANNGTQTISVWVKLASTAGTQNMVALVNSGSGSGVQVGVNGGNIAAWSWGGGVLVSRAAPGDGLWHHIASTWTARSPAPPAPTSLPPPRPRTSAPTTAAPSS
jgi:hypothetical protein